ncbi:ribbon-helix-helix protein, CopG family [Lentzea sp. NPDC058436]|uniref:ribbon-helix-helix protein, CopG family n=1 Tax=Lentzea sp. NPDC058436 TaxID=3346499 RepID=UPI0036635A18
MDLTPYVASLGRELLTAVETGGDEANALVERLTVTMESAIRLALLEALSAAADEITADLAPDSVQVLLRGRDPKFVVTRRAPEPAAATPEPAPAPPAEDVAAGYEDGTTVRINVRLPEPLKAAIDEAAAKEGRSANAWLVRAASAQLNPKREQTIAEAVLGDITGSQRFVGWVR